MTPYEHYLELREQQKQIHISHRDDYAAMGEQIDEVLALLDDDVEAFFDTPSAGYPLKALQRLTRETKIPFRASSWRSTACVLARRIRGCS